MSLLMASRYKCPNRPMMIFLLIWFWRVLGGSRGFLVRVERQYLRGRLIISIILKVPHLEARNHSVESILSGWFIQLCWLHMVLHVVMVCMGFVPSSQYLVHLQLPLLMHHHYGVYYDGYSCHQGKSQTHQLRRTKCCFECRDASHIRRYHPRFRRPQQALVL